ncbi:MAG: hypothetical protein KGS45_10300 [Planctomycetes bacterium]|nr:hypothetical protein [Planctomycetota bacterium]
MNNPLTHLETVDLNLLNLIARNSFDLASLAPSLQGQHPACDSYTSLLLWVESDPIRPAFEYLQAKAAENALRAERGRQERARDALDYAIYIARDALARACMKKDQKESNDLAHRLIRELRLLARALISPTSTNTTRGSKEKPTTPKAPAPVEPLANSIMNESDAARTSDAPTSSHHTAPKSDTSDSSPTSPNPLHISLNASLTKHLSAPAQESSTSTAALLASAAGLANST